VIDKFPAIATSPVKAILPVVPVNDNGVFVTPPSLIVKLKFLSSDVCATVTLLLVTEIVNSCASPTIKPVSLSIVNAPVVVSDASALRTFPPAIIVPDVFVVPETSMFAA
jgi:hypothetical protein